MKGDKHYQQGMLLLNSLHKKYKKMREEEISAQHSRYISLIRKAAYLGHVEAQYELALNYEDQNYFLINPIFNISKRAYWYNKACSASHPDACNNLASLYERGEGVKKNLKKAALLYRKAYKLGCAHAKENYRLLATKSAAMTK